MSAGRMFATLAVIAAGMLAAGLLISKGARTLHNDGLFNPGAPGLLQPGPAAGPTHQVRHGPTPRRVPAAHPGLPPRRARPARRPTGAPVKPVRQRPGAERSGGLLGLGELKVVLVAALEIAAGVALIAMVGAVLVLRRVRRRSRRRYELYELHLSTHDQAKPQDLEDMVESIANIVRAWPADRVRHGQPYLALELTCAGASRTGGGHELEWSINIRCEPKTVAALDGAISAAYPDVRLGRVHGEQPRPRAGGLREPGHLMRFRKERSFVYSLIADGEEQASSPLEQIARSQIAAGAPSIVRFQLTPTPSFFEELARRLYRRHENKLVRQERWGLPEGGLWSTFNRAEMRAAERTQNRSLFWLETVVAADSREVCKTVGAAVQSRRGENRLHRRWMVIRQRLYRRRFPRALGPLIPSFRTLVSAAEVAHLLELPSARMKASPSAGSRSRGSPPLPRSVAAAARAPSSTRPPTAARTGAPPVQQPASP